MATLERDTSLLPFAAELRSQGFRRNGSDRDPLNYVKDSGERRLDIQLWRDGGHRASHWLVHPHDPRRARMTTRPTGFRTLDEMAEALQRELTRDDHPADARP